MNKAVLGGVITMTAVLLVPMAVSAQAMGPLFTQSLRVGSRGGEVIQLQQRLIGEGLLAAGNATGYFGSLTGDAVKKFQAKHGIEMVGVVGPQTRAVLNATAASTKTGDVLGASAFNFTLDLSLGSTGDEVTQLQQRLMREGLLSNKETLGRFGELTREALIQFQKNNQIEPLGIVGPQTREVLNKAKLQ